MDKSNAGEGLGIGLGMAVFGVVLLLLPVFIDLPGGWVTCVYVVSILITFGGSGGALLELATLRGRPPLSDLGTAVGILGIAVGLLLVWFREELPQWLGIVLVVLALVVIFFAIAGAGIGLSKMAHDQSAAVVAGTSGRSSGTPKAVAISTHKEFLSRVDKINIAVPVVCTLISSMAAIVAARL